MSAGSGFAFSSGEFGQLLKQALRPFSDGNSEVSIDRLSDLERSLRAGQGALDDAEKRHCILWTQLQRAAIQEEVCDLEDAEILLRQILSETRRLTRLDLTGLRECYCLEHFNSSLSLARVLMYRGEFSESIRLLDSTDEALIGLPFHGSPVSFEEMTSLKYLSSEMLGYDRGVPDYEDRSLRAETDPKSDLHWRIPAALCGDNYARLRNEREVFLETYQTMDGFSEERFDALLLLRASISRWADEFPAAVIPKQWNALYEVRKASFEIELNRLEVLEETMNSAQMLLEEELEVSAESVFHYLALVRELVSLATAIGWHEYGDDELRRRLVQLSYLCVTTSRNLLDLVFENSPLTQAVGIVTAKCSSVASSVFEMFGQSQQAIEEGTRCRTIIEEVLKRDPDNDVAGRLKIAFDKVPVHTDLAIEAEVRGLNWSIGSSR